MSFAEHTQELRGLAGRCDDLKRIANPYFQAAEWELGEEGRSVARVVGLNTAVDMQVAVDKLTGIGRSCTNCGISDAVCQFAGVEKMPQSEILALEV